MKKQTKIVSAESEDTFNTRLAKWESQGWIPIPESFTIAKAGTGIDTSIYNTYGIVIQRNVVEPRNVIDPATPHVSEPYDPRMIGHSLGCLCCVCR